MILCSFKNLHLSFGPKQLFKNAELTIEESDRIGLLGLNGKGKSSLFKILEGLQAPDTSHPPFIFDQHQSFSLFHVPQELPSKISEQTSLQDCFWEFYPQFKELHLELNKINASLEAGKNNERDLIRQNEIFETLEQNQIWSLFSEFESYCKSFGLHHLQTPLSQLSGGEKKKILLSLGLSSNKSLILWDEPTNHLDIETIKTFEEELQNSSTPFILITHDRYLLGKVTNKIVQIKNQQILSFKSGYRDYLELEAQREKERELLLNKLKNSFRREDAWMKQGIKARGTRSKKRVENFNTIKDQIHKLKMQAKKELTLSLSQGERKSKQLIHVKNLSFSYPDKELFSQFNFSIYKGDKIGLLGTNGVGKSTLIKIISDQSPPSQREKEAKKQQGKQQRGEIRWAPEIKIKVFTQQREELHLETTPYELLGEGSDQVFLPNGQSQHVVSYFKKFLFNGDEIHRPLRTFSGGERNRLQLAFNLKQQADIWIFDEPTNDLDLETLDILEKTLQEFKGSLIIISHDRAFLKNITNRLFLIENKKLEVFEGGLEQAEIYLEAKALEEKILKESTSSAKPLPPSSQNESSPKKQRTHPQLEKEILETEKLIDKIDSLMIEISQLEQTKERGLKLSQLSHKKLEKEDLLLQLYEELEK